MTNTEKSLQKEINATRKRINNSRSRWASHMQNAPSHNGQPVTSCHQCMNFRASLETYNSFLTDYERQLKSLRRGRKK